MRKLILPTIFILAFLALSWFLFWTTPWDLNSTYPFLAVAAVKIGAILAIILVLSLLLFVLVIRPKDLGAPARNAGLAVYAFLLVFFVLEGAFIFVAQSQVAGTTLAYKRWMDYYWHPINEIGFRDRNILDDDLGGKIKVMAVGDSFTAGHGIQKIEDRYTDVLQGMLPGHYRVLNLGRDGVDTATELYRLFSFPIKPDILIFQYYGNDIEGVCVADGREAERDEHFVQYREYPEFSGPAKWLVKNSYLLNFTYWQAVSRKDVSYFDFVVPCYENPRVLARHVAMLQALIDYCREKNIPLVVVLFPFMLAIDESGFYMDGISRFFDGQGVPVIDVGKLARDIPPKKRIVGRLDSHAHPRVHKLVAQEIYGILVQGGYVR